MRASTTSDLWVGLSDGSIACARVAIDARGAVTAQRRARAAAPSDVARGGVATLHMAARAPRCVAALACHDDGAVLLWQQRVDDGELQLTRVIEARTAHRNDRTAGQ